MSVQELDNKIARIRAKMIQKTSHREWNLVRRKLIQQCVVEIMKKESKRCI